MNNKKILHSMAISSLLILTTTSYAIDTQSCAKNNRKTTADSRYEAVGNGEVKDKQTGLIWQRCLVGETWNGNACIGTENIKLLSWHDALITAKTKADSSNKPYRLPNIKELASLTSYGCTPAFNTTYFEKGVDFFDLDDAYGFEIWSSSPNLANTDSAYVMNQSSGSLRPSQQGDTYAVRLVRSEK